MSTGPWVTAAETAECALALDAVGRGREALDLLTWTRAHRRDDGSYWTGIVYPELETFPFSERTTYTAGAIVLAADALSNATPAAGLFRGEGLPAALDLAASYQLSLWDCVYLALALEYDCPLLAADRRLVRGVRGRHAAVQFVG